MAGTNPLAAPIATTAPREGVSSGTRGLRLLGRIGFHTLLAIVACGALFGLIGAVFAIPLAAVSQTLFERLVLQADFKEKVFTASRDAAGVMHYQLQDLINDVKRQQRQKNTPVDAWTTETFAEIETLASALDELVMEEAEEEQPGASTLPAPVMAAVTAAAQTTGAR